MKAKNYSKTGNKPGKPAFRTPSFFKNARNFKQKGFKAPFRKPSV